MNDAIDSIRTSRPDMSSRTVFALWDNSSLGRRDPALARSTVEVHHIPLDEVRDPITAGRLPLLGTCAGWPDLQKNLGTRLCRRGAAIFTRPFAYDAGRS